MPYNGLCKIISTTTNDEYKRSALIIKTMETNLEQLKCGQCGTEKHLVYQRQNGEILLECIECGSTSEITITQPKIVIRNISGLGTICPQS